MARFAAQPTDLLIILFATALIVATSVTVYADRGRGIRVEITTAGVTEVHPLSEAKIVTAKGPLGSTRVEIGETGVRILDSPCPDKLCIHMGIVDGPGQWIACLPNRVFVRIKGKEESPVDAVSF